jgi:hypothetical protein
MVTTRSQQTDHWYDLDPTTQLQTLLANPPPKHWCLNKSKTKNWYEYLTEHTTDTILPLITSCIPHQKDMQMHYATTST